MMKGSALLLTFFFSLTVTAQKEDSLIQVTDLLKIKTAANITVSVDGTKAAFTLTTVEPDERLKNDYKYLTQIYMVDLTVPKPEPRQVTFGKESASNPVWHPSGNSLAFVRTAEGKPQIFILPLQGGEAWQLTRSVYGATIPKWLPDGAHMAYASVVSYKELLKDSLLNPGRSLPLWPSEKPGLQNTDLQRAASAKPSPNGNLNEIRAYLQNNEADGKALVLNKLNFQDEANISGSMNFTQFFRTEVKQNATPVPLLKGFNRFSSIEFTPDGKQMILTADIDSSEHPDRSQESEIFLANSDGSNLRQLLGKKEMSYNNARLSPSGKWLLFQYGPVNSEVPALAIMPLNGTESEAFTIPFDRQKSNYTWSNDEKWVYFTAQSNGGTPLYRLNVAARKVEQLSDYQTGTISFGLGKSKILFSRTDISNPSEVYLADENGKNIVKLTAFNSWVQSKKLAGVQKKTFVNNKGLNIEYWVMKPTQIVEGKKYPLLLEIHGGPAAMWGPGEAGMWHEYQYFCSRGYGVVYSNPRGSGGYGADFVRANVADWGSGPASDVLTALDKTVQEGWADTGKLLITGGSYAGYLTAWIIAHDKRFKAACSQRGVYDLATFFGEGNAWRLVPRYFGGYPWEKNVRELLVRESPITYVERITTPFIIFHGDNDRRTGFVQSEMLYRSLKVLGRPVEYVRHPGATHEITRSGDNRQRIDQMLRTYEFFERYIN